MASITTVLTAEHSLAEEGMVVGIANHAAQVIHPPGHTPGSICLHFAPENLLLAGDTLFAGSIGRTDLPGGDYDTILASLARVCLSLPDETVVLAGHGPQTTIGAEREHNPFLAGLTPARGPVTGL